jgi:hypothetical protein
LPLFAHIVSWDFILHPGGSPRGIQTVRKSSPASR